MLSRVDRVDPSRGSAPSEDQGGPALRENAGWHRPEDVRISQVGEDADAHDLHQHVGEKDSTPVRQSARRYMTAVRDLTSGYRGAFEAHIREDETAPSRRRRCIRASPDNLVASMKNRPPMPTRKSVPVLRSVSMLVTWSSHEFDDVNDGQRSDERDDDDVVKTLVLVVDQR